VGWARPRRLAAAGCVAQHAGALGSVVAGAPEHGDGLALHVDDPSAAAPATTPTTALDRVETILAQGEAPLSLKALRAAAKMRAATVSDALAALVTQGRARRTDTGYLAVAR